MRITRNQLREIIIEQIRQGGPEDLWASEEGRPESTRDSDGDGRSDSQELKNIASAMEDDSPALRAADRYVLTQAHTDWLADVLAWASMDEAERIATKVSDAFGKQMRSLFITEPTMFTGKDTQDEWDDMVHNAQLELDNALEVALKEFLDERFPEIVDDFEGRLASGDFRRGNWGGPER